MIGRGFEACCCAPVLIHGNKTLFIYHYSAFCTVQLPCPSTVVGLYCTAMPFVIVKCMHLAVDVFPLRHSARPFHHTRPSIACLHPPHPPTVPPKLLLLLPYHQQPERLPSPRPPFPRPPFSPPLLRPPLLPLHSIAHSVLYCLLCSVAHYTARPCPRRPEGTPAMSPERRRSPLESQYYRLPVLGTFR
jgi:hypothetical protein